MRLCLRILGELKRELNVSLLADNNAKKVNHIPDGIFREMTWNAWHAND